MSKDFLSPEQQKVVDTWGLGMAVLAGAGSGKTTTLVTKCYDLLTRNPKAKLVAVSFTERSASDLRTKLSKMLSSSGQSAGLHHHWVTTIHGLCGAIIRENFRPAGLDGEETVLSESESKVLWGWAAESLWSEDLPDEVRVHFEALLGRESQSSIFDLLHRAKDLSIFGVFNYLESSSDPFSKSLSVVSQYVLGKYDRLKRRRGALDFQDLEKYANVILDSRSVREFYHKRFDLVLVDEFQDTNPIQAKIIWKLAKPSLSNLCVVGDPKQSIYRFRDADVSVFEEYCAKLPVKLSLTWNFRSRPGIIDFTNRVCEKAFIESEMKFEALTAKRESKDPAVVKLNIKTPSDLGQWILSQVEQGIPLHEMVVLVRKVRGNEKWFKALSGAGIPIAVGSGGLFWEDPRVREMVAFLKWWDNPGNSLSGAVFLRAPWVGISDQLLDQWAKQDPTFAVFFESSHPLAQALNPLRSKTVRPGELLMALADILEVNELSSPLLSLWHKVEELSSRGLSFHHVISDLSLAVKESRREREVPAPKNLGQLSILTFHGAKGLEFPYVILIDLGEKSKSPDTPLLFWDRNRGAYLGARTEDGERDQKNPTEKTWREQEKRKNLEESKRLFYVALTRAQEKLVLVCPPIESSFDAKTVYLMDHWRGWIDCSGCMIPELTPPESSDAAKFHRIEIPSVEGKEKKRIQSFGHTRARHSVTEWNLLSRCPRAYEWSYIRPVAVAEGIPEVGLFTGGRIPTLAENQLSYQELGSRVHSCLERGDYDGLLDLEKQVGPNRFLAEPVISWALSTDWMAPSQNGREVWTELTFEVPIESQVLVGAMDRIVVDYSSGIYHLIDFKITEKPKSVNGLFDAYQTQIELYAWALQSLEPKAHFEKIKPLLVNISCGHVQAVPVTLGKVEVGQLARHAAEIVNGQSGIPKPSYLCKMCEFRTQCPEGRT